MNHSKQWHDARRRGIGGSDAPIVVLGTHYRRTAIDLYNEKRGNTEPPDLSDNPDVQRGIVLEPIAREVFENATGRATLVPDDAVTNDAYPFARGNVDGIVLDDDNQPIGVLEIKVPRTYSVARIRDQGVPDHYQIQCQHYLMITDLPVAYLAIFDVNEWTCEIYELPRNERLIKQIAKREKAFWDCVIAGTPPALESDPVTVPVVGKTAVTIEDSSEPYALAMSAYKRALYLSRQATTDLADAKRALAAAWPEIEKGKLAKTIIWEDSIRVSATPSKKTGELNFRPTLLEE